MNRLSLPAGSKLQSGSGDFLVSLIAALPTRLTGVSQQGQFWGKGLARLTDEIQRQASDLQLKDIAKSHCIPTPLCGLPYLVTSKDHSSYVPLGTTGCN